MQKTNFKTRLLALLTAAFMLVMCVPFAAFAAATDDTPNEISVSFNCWDATVVSEGATASGEHYATYKLNATSEYKSLPTLKDVPEDQEFKGWFIDGTDVEVVATSFNFDSLKAYAQNDSHAVSVSAKLVDKVVEPSEPEEPETPELKTINVSFVDATTGRSVADGISFTEGEGAYFPVSASNKGENDVLQGWNGFGFDAFYGAGQWVNFADLAKYVADSSINAEGVAALTFEADIVAGQPEEPEEPEAPELKTINVSFVDATTGRTVADGISFTEGEGAFFPKEASNMGENDVLQGWNGFGIDAFYGAGQWVNFADLAKYVVASGINKDGVAALTFEADIATKQPEQPSKPVATDVTKIYVHFNDEIGLYKTDIVYSDHGYITAPATDMSVSEYDYTWNNDEGLIFNVGDVIKFADVIAHAGSYYVEADGVVSAHISFTKTAKPQPSEDVLIKNIKFQISQVEGAKWAEKEYNDEGIDTRTYTVYSDVTEKYTAPAAAMDGKDFLYWVCQYGDKVIKINAGEQFNYDDMTAKGISATEVGDFAFNPVFKDKASDSNNSSSSSSSSSSNKTTTATSEQKVVKAAAAPANTTKVLPKTGASNVAPLLGGSLAVVALLMGYGVYSLVLRKKD